MYVPVANIYVWPIFTCGQYLRVANIYVWPISTCGQYLRVANIHEYNREGYSSTIREPKQTASFITVPEGEGLYRLVWTQSRIMDLQFSGSSSMVSVRLRSVFKALTIQGNECVLALLLTSKYYTVSFLSAVLYIYFVHNHSSPCNGHKTKFILYIINSNNNYYVIEPLQIKVLHTQHKLYY